jgi:uncharacterized protein
VTAAFFDSSALVKLLRVEPETDALVEWIETTETEHVASRLAVVEVTRAARHARTTADVLLGSLHFVELTPELLDRAAALDPPELRTLDAVQVASALIIGDALEAFVCYDARLQAAAKGHGLAVVAPGS